MPDNKKILKEIASTKIDTNVNKNILKDIANTKLPETFGTNLANPYTSQNTERPDLTGQVTPDITDETLNELRGKNQSNVETAFNNTMYGLGSVVTNIGRDLGYLYGTGKALSKAIDPNSDASIKDITDVGLVNLADDSQKYLNDHFPNYNTKDEVDNPVSLRNIVGTTFSSLSRDVAPFLASSMLTGAALGKVILAPAKLARLQKIASAGGEFVAKGENFAKGADWGSKQLVQTLLNNNEAMLEAHNTSDEVYESVKQKLIEQGIDEQTASNQATEASTEAFKQDWLLNTFILRLGNIEGKTLFKSALSSRRPLKESMKEFSQLTTKGQKALYLAKKANSYLDQVPQEIGEELGQGGASEVTKEQYTKDENKKLLDSNLLDTGLSTLGEAIKRIGTDEGKIEILTTALITAPFGIRNKIRDEREQRSNTESRKEVYNKSINSNYQDIEGLLEDKTDLTGNKVKKLSDKATNLLQTASTYNEFENLKNAALTINDNQTYDYLRDIQISNMAYGHFEAGLANTLDNKLNDLGEEIKKEYKDKGRDSIEDFSTGKNIPIDEYTKNLKDKVHLQEKIYNALESKYNITDSNTRQAAFKNAVLQTTLSKKIKEYQPSIGENFFNYTYEKNLKNQTQVDNHLQELGREAQLLSSSKDTSPSSLQRQTDINTILQDYKVLKDFEFLSTPLEVDDNRKNFKDNALNKQFFNKLKEHFDLMTNPEASKKYLEDKIKSKEELNKVDEVLTDQPQNAPLIKKEEVKKQKEVAKLSNEDNRKRILDKLNTDINLDTPKENKINTSDLNSITSDQAEGVRATSPAIPQDILDIINQRVDMSILEPDGIDVTKQDTKVINTLTKEEPDTEDNLYEGLKGTSASRVAYITENYTIEEDKNKISRKDLGEFNENYNINNTNPDSLPVGTTIELRKEKAEFVYLYKENGEIELNEDKTPKRELAKEGDFQISIYSGNTKIGNYHTPEWVKTTRKGTYINLEEEVVEEEYNKAKKIWDYFKDSSTPLKSTIIAKSNGILNTGDKSSLENNIPTLLNKLVKEDSTIIGAINKGVLKGNNNEVSLQHVLNNTEREGNVGMLVKTSNNSDIFLPLDCNKIGNKVSSDIVSLLKDYNKVGISPQELVDYVNKLFYTQSISNDELFTKGILNTKKPLIMALIVDNDGRIKIRASYQIEGIVKHLNKVKPELNESFYLDDLTKDQFNDLEVALSNSYFNVNVNILKDNFNLLSIQEGKLSTTPYKNYLDFLSKDVLSTNIKEFHNSNIFKQPNIYFDYDQLLPKEGQKVVEEVKKSDKETLPSEFDIEFEDESDVTTNKENPEDKKILESAGLKLSEDISNEELDRRFLANFIVEDENGRSLNIGVQDIIKNQIISKFAEGIIYNNSDPNTLFNESINTYKTVFANREKFLNKVPKENFDNFIKGLKENNNLPQWLENRSYEDLIKEKETAEFVVNNFTKFIDLVKKELEDKYFIKIKGTLIEDNDRSFNDFDEEEIDSGESEIGGNESILNKDKFDQNSAEFDPRQTTNWRLKLMLLGVENNKIKNGFKNYYPFDVVYATLKRELVDQTDLSFDNFYRVLIDSKQDLLTQVAEKFKNLNSKNRQLFITAINGQSNNQTIQLLDTKTKETKVIDSNQYDVVKSIISRWNENIKDSNFIIKKQDGEIIVNKTIVKELKESFKKGVEGNLIDKQNFLNKLNKDLNLHLTKETISGLQNTEVLTTLLAKTGLGNTFEGSFKPKGMFHILMDILDKNIDSKEEILLESNNPFKDNKQSVINHIARLESKYTDSTQTDSFQNGENKTIWGYRLPTYLSRTFSKLKNSSDYTNLVLRSAYSSTSEFLNKKIFSNLKTKLYYNDSLKIDKEDAIVRSSQSKTEQLLSYIIEFTKSNDTASFYLPTLSDKTESPVIKNIPKIKNILITKNSKGVYEYLDSKTEDSITDKIFNIVNGELLRIREVNALKALAITEEEIKELKDLLGEKYYEGSNYIFSFPELNKHLPKLNDPEFNTIIKKELKIILNKMINDSVSTFKNNGIEDYIPKNYRQDLVANEENRLATLAADITINYAYFYGNYNQSISGDIAQFWKKNVDETLKEYQKRLASNIAPGLETHWDNQNYNIVVANDAIISIDKSNKFLNSEDFKKYYGKGINTTDAQEFTTLKEHLNTLFAYGKINKDEFKNFSTKEHYTDEELKKILDKEVISALKPVQVCNKPDIVHYKGLTHNLNRIMYIKSSSIPLIPQITKGFDIDTIRQAMEESGVDRISFTSAVKSGATKIIDIFDKDKETLKQEFSISKVLMNREGFRIQQELPYDVNKSEIGVISQLNKLLFEGIADEEFILKDNKFTGRQLKNLKEGIRKEQFKRNTNKLLKELDITIDPNGNMLFNSMDKIKEVLTRDSASFNINDIFNLETDPTTGLFKIPLGYNNSSDRFTPKLMKLVTNVINTKVPGKSFVQGSAVGFKNLSDVNTSDIIFTSSFNKEKGLQYIDIKEGVVQPAQVILPFQFRDNQGNLLDIKNFLTEEGLLDNTKLPKELLNLVAARIPNQSFSSDLPIEVVGFLPSTYGDFIIVPDGVTIQMGSDFDIDKLYTYFNNYYFDSNIQKFNKVDYDLNSTTIEEFNDDQLNQLYTDIHWNILTNKEVIKRVVSPLDKDDIKELTSKVKSLNESTTTHSPLYFINQINDYTSQISAKVLVGSSSLSSTFNAIAQYQDLYLQKIEEGKVKKDSINRLGGLKLSNISNVKSNFKYNTEYNGDPRTVADNISILQNSFLDNAKEPYAGILNINEYTYDGVIGMTILKDDNNQSLDLSYPAYMTSQKIIRDLSIELERLNSKLNDEFTNDKFESALFAVMYRYIIKYRDLTGGKSELPSLEEKIYTTKDLEQDLIINETSPEWLLNQVEYLNIFSKFNKVGKSIKQIQVALNSDTKGAGKDMFEVLDKINKVNELEDIKNIANIEQLIQGTETGEAFKYSNVLADKLFSKFYDYASKDYISMENRLSKMLSKSLTDKLKRKIWKSYKSYLYTNPELGLVGNIEETRKELLMSENSLAKRLIKFKNNPKYVNNLLIQRLNFQLRDKYNPYHLVTFNASSADRLDEQDIIKHWMSLFNGTEEEREFSNDLVSYSYVTNGVQTANNFVKYIPAPILFRTNLKSIKAGSYNSFIEQYVQHNYNDLPRITNLKEFTIGKDSTNNPDYSTLQINDKTGEKYFNFVNGVKVFKPYLYYEKEVIQDNGRNTLVRRLYKLDKDKNAYNTIPLLGTYKLGFLEYNHDNNSYPSIIQENNNYVNFNKLRNTNQVEQFPVENPSIEKVDVDTDFNDILKDLKLGDNKEGLINSLLEINKNSSNESYKKIAEILSLNSLNIPNGLKIEKIEGSNESNSQATYDIDNSLMKIYSVGHNTTAIAKGKSKASREDYENSILHETIHIQTVDLIRKYRENKNHPIFQNNPELVNNLKRLIALYNQAKDIYQKEIDNAKNDKKEGFYNSLSSLNIAEGFKNLEEFISYSLTNKEFQGLLVELKSNGSTKSTFDKLIDILTSLYKSIANTLGVDINKFNESVLKDVIDNSIQLTLTQNIDNSIKEKVNTSQELNSLGMSIVDFMKELNSEERDKFRILVKNNIIKTKC